MSTSLSRWLGAGLALLTACACLAQPSGGVLRVRLNADIRSTEPGFNRDDNTDAVLLHMAEGLVAYREDASVGPLLAQAIDVSADGRSYSFRLRPGLKFSNGAPLTADDVLWSWQRYMAPAANWRCLAEFDGRGAMKVTEVKARDAATVVFTLDKPNALFLATLARADCGSAAILHRSSVDADGKWREPVGTGPYKLAEWKRGQSVELVRNEQHQPLAGVRDGHTGRKTAEVPRLRFVVIPDPSAAKAALLSGAVDLIHDINDEDMAEYKGRKDLVLESTPTMNVQGLLFQTRDPLLKDVRLRRAIAAALDLPELVAVVTTGNARASRSVIPVPSAFHKAAQSTLPKRDLALARRLAAEAGYKGQPIKLLATKRYQSVYTIAILAQAMAQEAGIKLEVEVLEWATLLDRYNKGDYQAMAFTYSARLDPALSYEMVSGDKDKQPRKVWDNPQALALIAKSTQTADRAQRQALFDTLETKLREDVPAVFMYSAVITSAARQNVVGYKGWPLGHPRLWGVALK